MCLGLTFANTRNKEYVMSKRLLSILLISAAFPLAASAQTSSGEPGTTITNPEAAGSATTSQNNASGGMNDTQPVMNQLADASATTEGPFVTVPESGAWRVTDFEGKAVYGAEGESIGEINDVLVSQDGSVNAVIIGVGGFLGIGEKNVAIDMGALELGPGASQAEANAAAANMPDVSGETTASTDTMTTPPAGGAGTATTADRTAMNDNNAASDNTTTGTGMPATSDDQMAANTNDAVDDTIQIGPDGLPDRIVLNVTRQQLEDAPAFEGVRSEVQGQQ
nr:photosystem reaction center subunit H [Rhizobium sp. Q54]